MFMVRARVLLYASIVLLHIHPGFSQLSKGHRILIKRGLQLQGLSQDDCYLTLVTYSNANYTSIDWINSPGTHSSRPDWMGPPPGFPWARWAADETQMPPQITPYGGDETPYTNQLLAITLADEWNLNDDATRTRLVNWFLSVKTNWPNTLLYHNNYGSQVDDFHLADFYTRAHPDMLCFDTYPWQSVYDINASNHTGAPIPGPPTGWYGDLRRYREHARGASIPLGLYRQTFHAVQDYDQHVFRDPSPSELRLNTFAGLAFNAKLLTDFVYNTGAASLFQKIFNGSGDTQTNSNGLYAEMVDVNRRAFNFGKALVRLTAITVEAAQGYTTSIMFIRGQDSTGALNPIPIGFLADPVNPNLYTQWTYQLNDPYLTNNWTVTNLGTKNNGNPGDVIIAWFKALDESFDGTNYTNERYLMVVNGLTDPTGTAADCLQEIRLNFASSLLAVDMMDPLTGNIQAQPLTLTNSLRQLVLDLNGGDAALFKFSDGAPFISSQIVAPAISVQPQSQSVSSGSNVLFTVIAAGNPSPAYQWQLNGTNIYGATTSGYTRTNAQSADSGVYSVSVSNVIETVLSSGALLTVNGPPSITKQPSSLAVLTGSTASFTVNAVGSGLLTYQWQKAGVNLSDGGKSSGSMTPTLTITNVQAGELGSYSILVSNAYGASASSAATLAIATPPLIQTQPQNRTASAGSLVLFSVSATGNGLTYQWMRNGTNLVDAGNIAGSTTATLLLTGVTRLDATNYTVVITNAAGSITSSPASLAVTFAFPVKEPFQYAAGSYLSNQVSPDFLSWADVGTSTAGPSITNASGNLDVAGLAPSSGNSIFFGGVGKSARLSLTSPINSGTFYYSFALKVLDLTGAPSGGGFIAGFNNSIGTQTGQPTVIGTRLYLRPTTGGFNLGVAKNSSTATDWVWDGTVYSVNQTVFVVGSYTFTTVGNSTDDICKMWLNPDPSTFGAPVPPPPTLTATSGSDISANQIASFVFFQRGSTVEPAAMLADELRLDSSWAGVTPAAAPLLITPPFDRTNDPGTTASFTVSAAGNYLSYVWLHNGVALTNGGNISGATTAVLTLSSVSNTDAGAYSVLVSSGGGSVLSPPAILTVTAPPQISTQPEDQTVNVGGTASFNVIATSAGQLAYQWQFYGSNIPNATASAFSFGGVQRTNAGPYSVVIINAAGTAISSNAQLTVNPVTPVRFDSITLLPNGQVSLQGSGDPGYFIVQASSNLTDWLNVTNILGAQGSFQYIDSVTNFPQRFYRAKLYP
jgi:hypothetical protein